MELDIFLRMMLGLLIVLLGLGLVLMFMRKFGLGTNQSKLRSRHKRCSIVETHLVDTKRRLIIVRRDNKEHLILLGPSGDLIVENNIPDQIEIFQETLDIDAKKQKNEGNNFELRAQT